MVSQNLPFYPMPDHVMTRFQKLGATRAPSRSRVHLCKQKTTSQTKSPFYFPLLQVPLLSLSAVASCHISGSKHDGNGRRSRRERVRRWRQCRARRTHSADGSGGIYILATGFKVKHKLLGRLTLTCIQGIGGLTKRDISLVTDAGLYTVEAVAYT